MPDAARARPGGRTARIRASVLDATIAELADRGYVALTVEGVAARAGVHKATLYRRWGGREQLLLDAVESFATASVPEVPDTGSLDDDLRLWARSIVATVTARDGGAIVRALSRAGDAPQVRELQRRYHLTRLAKVLPIVERAVERGQLPTGTDATEVIKHVGAPLYYRLLVIAESVTVDAADLAAAAAAAAARAGVFVRG